MKRITSFIGVDADERGFLKWQYKIDENVENVLGDFGKKEGVFDLNGEYSVLKYLEICLEI